MFTLKNHQISPSEVLSDAFSLYKTSFCVAAPLALLSVAISVLPSFFSFPNTATHFIVSTICLLIGFLFMTAMIFRIYCIAYQIPHDLSHALKQGVRKLFPLVLLSLLYAIIVLSGTMLLIVPGVILAVSLMFSFVLLITDNHNILQSVMTSHRLTWENWLYTLFMVSFPILMNLLLLMLGIVGLMVLFTFNQFPSQYFLVTATLLSIVIQSLLIPFVFSTVLILIYNLKQKTSNLYVT